MGIAENPLVGKVARFTRRKAEQVAIPVGLGATGLVAFNAGFQIGINTSENPTDFEITQEPYEVEIRRFEERFKPNNLRNEKVRSKYMWLLSQWLASDKTFDVFEDEGHQTVSNRVYHAIEFITDPSDKRLQNHETDAAWAEPHESIFFNLTIDQFNQKYAPNATGALLTPYMFLRDTFTHEFVHFIVLERSDQEMISIIRNRKREYDKYPNASVTGFKVLFWKDKELKEELDDFDEASVELIANYYQRNAGLVVGPPFYPDDNRPNIQQAISLLEATLEIVGLSIDDFAQHHAYSDFDGLAKTFASVSNRTFRSDIDQIEYGFSMIDSIRRGNKRQLLRLLRGSLI